MLYPHDARHVARLAAVLECNTVAYGLCTERAQRMRAEVADLLVRLQTVADEFAAHANKWPRTYQAAGVNLAPLAKES